MYKGKSYLIVVIISLLNCDIFCCWSLSKQKTTSRYLTNDSTVDFIINIKTKDKTNDFGDAYLDISSESEANNKKNKMHWLFFYDYDKDTFSDKTDYYINEDEKTVHKEDYLQTLKDLCKENYYTNHDFIYENVNFFLMNADNQRQIFLKLDKQEGDVIFGDCNVNIYKNYDKIKITYDPNGCGSTNVFIYKIFFKKANLIITLKVKKEGVQGRKEFFLRGTIHDTKTNKEIEKIAKNDQPCTYDISL